MSDAQQDSTTQPTPDRSSLQAGIDWVGKHWPRVRLGHEALMLDKIQRSQRIVETVARNAMTGQTDDTEGWPSSNGDDAMGVDIGDVVHNHYYPQPVPSAEPNTLPTKEKPTPEDALGTLALVVALLVAGIGLGVCLALLLVAFGKPEPPAVQQSIDTDTQYRLEIGEPK